MDDLFAVEAMNIIKFKKHSSNIAYIRNIIATYKLLLSIISNWTYFKNVTR